MPFPSCTLIGHRGLCARAPENTLQSLQVAAAAGFTWVEVDSRPAADGIAVLSHDDDLTRCAGVDLRVSQHPSAHLTDVQVGLGFSGDLATARLPTLTQALLCARQLGLGVVVELKTAPCSTGRMNPCSTGRINPCSTGRINPGGGAASAAAAARALAEAGAQPGEVMISSDSRRAIAQAALLLPDIARALVCEAVPDDWPELAQRWQLAGLHCPHRCVTASLLEEMTAARLELATYTVNSADRARELFAMGVQAVFTDGVASGPWPAGADTPRIPRK